MTGTALTPTQQQAVAVFTKEVALPDGCIKRISTPERRDGVLVTEITVEDPDGNQRSGSVGINAHGGYWFCLTMRYDRVQCRWEYPHDWSHGFLN